MAGSAGRTMSIDSAASAVSVAIRATNSGSRVWWVDCKWKSGKVEKCKKWKSKFRSSSGYFNTYFSTCSTFPLFYFTSEVELRADLEEPRRHDRQRIEIR